MSHHKILVPREEWKRAQRVLGEVDLTYVEEDGDEDVLDLDLFEGGVTIDPLDDGGGDGSPITHDTTPPDTPTGLFMVAGSPSIAVAWDLVPRAYSYEAQVATDLGFSNVVFEWQGSTVFFMWDGQFSTQYFVRVRALSRLGLSSPWSGAVADITIQIGAGGIGAGAITGVKIADDAITAPKIAANAVIADKIAANAVIAAKIAANAVIADKVAAGAITTAKLAVQDYLDYLAGGGEPAAPPSGAVRMFAEDISLGGETHTHLFTKNPSGAKRPVSLPFVKIHRSGAQTITDGTFTDIGFNSTSVNRWLGESPGTNNYITIPRDGIYLAFATCEMGNNQAQWHLRIRLDQYTSGDTLIRELGRRLFYVHATGIVPRIEIKEVFPANQGERIRAAVHQNSGANRSLTGGEYVTYMAVFWLRA